MTKDPVTPEVRSITLEYGPGGTISITVNGETTQVTHSGSISLYAKDCGPVRVVVGGRTFSTEEILSGRNPVHMDGQSPS